MFTTITHHIYQRKSGHEHIWIAGDNADLHCWFAGSVLGGEVIRVRALRGTLPDTDGPRYQLTDGGAGTLPYHSWSVAKGDEDWQGIMDEAETRTTLETYLHGFAFSSNAIRLTRPLASQERIFGLGERTSDMDKRGQAFPIWNIDPPIGHTAKTVTMYTSIPFYLGLQVDTGRAYGLLIDHSGLVEMDMGKSNEAEANMTVEGDSLVVYFFAGPTPADVLRQYTELTGRMPLPPHWALGYHQARWSYASEQQVRQLATNLREHHQPCDSIWLDIDYMNGFRSFTWNPETFPDPKAMIDDLHAQGLHLVTIIDPGIKKDENYFVYQQGMEHDYFCRSQDGDPFLGEVWPGVCVFPDYSRNDVREWWGSLYKDFVNLGVEGIWNDMNEPSAKPVHPSAQDESSIYFGTMSKDVLHRAGGDQPTGPDGAPVLHPFFHNAYGMEMARSTHEGLLRLRPDTRPFVLTRSSTAGMQRYAALWTGDNTSWWEHILMAMPMCLNISTSGVPFVGVDIGGFWKASDGELLTRFTQLGALLPLCRNHNAQDNPDQEPWAFGEPYESACRQAIELRYRLMPYLYTLFHEAATSGAPIIRPLYYHYSQDEQACDTEDEFLLGDALLSAPIYEQGAISRSVYFPEGRWFDYWDGNEYPGNGWSDIPAPLERWPLFVRSNSIIPTGPLMQYTGQHATDPLTFTCYMADDGLAHYTLYEDDGSTLAYRDGAYAQISISCRVGRDVTEVSIEERFTNYRPQREWYEVIVHAGGQALQQRVKAGRGKVVFTL